MTRTTSLFYSIEGEKGEDPLHPNLLHIPYSGDHPNLMDVLRVWPLNSDCVFRFKTPNAKGGNYMWKYIQPEEGLPLFHGAYHAEVIINEIDDSTESDYSFESDSHDEDDAWHDLTYGFNVNLNSDKDQRRNRSKSTSTKSNKSRTTSGRVTKGDVRSKTKSFFSGVSSWAKGTAKNTVKWAKDGGAADVAKKSANFASKLTGIASGLINGTKSYEIEGETVTVLKTIAEGGFSTVFLVKYNHSDTPMALKRILCENDETVAEAMNEAKVHQSVDHPNILPLFAVDINVSNIKGKLQKEVLFLFPFYPGGSLFDIVWKAEESYGAAAWPLNEQSILVIFLGICRGALALHRKGIVHLDIKPHNVLLSYSDGDINNLYNAIPILMDFGSCDVARVEVTSRTQALSIQDSASVKCSLAYKSPELYDVSSNCVLDTKRDVWSLGCTLYFMAFGWNPFESSSSGIETLGIINGNVKFPDDNRHFNEVYTNGFTDLIKRILIPDPADRPSLLQVMQQVEQLIS